MTAALKMVPEDTPKARLNQLKRARSELLARAAQLTAARQRLDGAADCERAATAAIGEFDAVRDSRCQRMGFHGRLWRATDA